MSVFTPRKTFKPTEYPWASEFKDAIRSSYWVVDGHFAFDTDVHEYRTLLSSPEREAVRRAMLAIAQVEVVAAKDFWGDLNKRFPKPEFGQVGHTFAESEARHADAYSALLEALGLNQDFAGLMAVPAVGGRIDYLTKHLAVGSDPQSHVLAVILFSLLVENVSLFAQFAVMKSVCKHRGLLKVIDNVVQATQQEEQLHALFGVKLVNQVRLENPEWFDAAFYERVYAACRKAEAAEAGIVDWMLEGGDLPNLSAATLKAFIRHRLNESLAMVGGKPQFDIDPAVRPALDELNNWFFVELVGRINFDFFDKQPTNYGRGGEPLTADTMFDD